MDRPKKPDPVGTLIRSKKEHVVISYVPSGTTLQNVIDNYFPGAPLDHIVVEGHGSYDDYEVHLQLLRPKTQEQYDADMLEYNKRMAVWVRDQERNLRNKKTKLAAQLEEVDLLLEEINKDEDW